MLFFLLILQIIAVNLCSGEVCTWPEDFVDSTWIDSVKGDMVFSSTTMSGWRFDVDIQLTASVQTLDSWECVSQSSPYLIMKTTKTFIQFVNEYTGYRCIIPEKITDYSYRYYQTEPIQPRVENERVFINPNDALTDPSILCQFPSTGAEFQVMIKKGYETSAKVVCPYSLLADYTFTYSQSDGTVTCDAVNDQGAVYMCTNVTEVSVQAPACSPYPLYSSENSSWCVDVVTVGSDTFVSLYNGQQDSSIPNTYQFVCVGINSEGTSMSVTPQNCKAGQSSTEIPIDNSGSNVGAVWSLSISSDPCPNCPTLSDPFRGSVNVSTKGVVTTATYGCDDTYSLSGNDARICQANGDWSDSEPSCACPVSSGLSNGIVNLTNGGLIVTFTCDAGYVLVGTSTLACNIVTSNWSDAYPTCEECETLPEPSDGTVTIISNGLTSVATYACDTGTTLNGGSSRTCTTDTTWTNAAPTCTSCPILSDIASGNVTLSTDDTTTTATYYCATGYTLNGDNTSTCTISGTWDSTPPSCASCPTLSDIASGNVTLSTDGTTTTATYYCATGYTLIGDNTSICTISGTWDSTPPSCECDDPLSPDNGTVTVSADKTHAKYTCNIGFTLHGVSTRTCQMDGTGWSSNDPLCVGCPSLSSPNNGSVSVSTNGILTEATFTCVVGFTLNGDVTSRCQIDGSWSTIAPTCSQCDVVPTVSSGSYTLMSDGSITSARYTCSVGTTISGDVTIACDVNGVWSISPENTTCVECPDLSTPGGSYEISSNGTISTAELVCDTGYVLESGDTIECQSNGSWSSNLVESQCVSITSTTTPVPSESKSGGSNLLPAVIALGVLAVGLGIAFGLSVFYIWKLKNNAQGSSKLQSYYKMSKRTCVTSFSYN